MTSGTARAPKQLGARALRRLSDPAVQARADIHTEHRARREAAFVASRRAELADAARRLDTGNERTPGSTGLEPEFWPDHTPRITLTGYGG